MSTNFSTTSPMDAPRGGDLGFSRQNRRRMIQRSLRGSCALSSPAPKPGQTGSTVTSHEDHTIEHPGLAAHRAQRRESVALRLADAITAFAGSMRFAALHVVWFGVWIIFNLVGPRFDPFPFRLLTMLVSLEAIFLSTFVLISQNRFEERQHLVVEHHYRETRLLESLLRENTRLTQEIHNVTAQAGPESGPR